MLKHFAAAALVAAITFSGVASAAPTKIDDPVKFVTAVYKKVGSPNAGPTPDDIYSPRLAALWALDTKEAGGEVGRFEADIWTNAQDVDHFKVLSIKGQDAEGAKGTRKLVIVKFHNGTADHTNVFYFEKSAAGWKLDDVVALGQDGYTLSVVLKYGWVMNP